MYTIQIFRKLQPSPHYSCKTQKSSNYHKCPKPKRLENRDRLAVALSIDTTLYIQVESCKGSCRELVQAAKMEAKYKEKFVRSPTSTLATLSRSSKQSIVPN